jgi:hypothetical protein
MSKLRALQIVFTFAALLFVAKPFLGFKAFNRQNRPRISHTVLVKSFTKRKPEDLREGYAKARALSQLLSDPPLKLSSAIVLLVAALLPLVIENITGSTQIANTNIAMEPVPAWLLTGKLSI